MNIGYVKFIRPNNHLLSKWIKGYYIHSAQEVDFYSKVVFYQNITTTLSIYKDSVTSSDGRDRKQHYKKNSGFNVLLAGLVDKYQQVEFYGPLDRLAIVFHPFGLNQFMRASLGAHLKKHYSHFHYFEEAFQDLLPKVFDISALEDKRDLLDNFFSNQYELLDEPALLNAVDLLQSEEGVIKVERLADELNVSRRTLLRKFKKHLGYSIEEYISVIKFRRALLNFQKKEDYEKLSDIALDSMYYDQSDFNHHIKSRSDLTPRALFNQLKIIDDTLFWNLE